MELIPIAIDCVDMINMLTLLLNRKSLYINRIHISVFDGNRIHRLGNIQWILTPHEFCWCKLDNFWEYRYVHRVGEINEWTNKRWVHMTERTAHALSLLSQVYTELTQLISFRLIQFNYI